MGGPSDSTAPVFIRLSVTSIICLLAPLTQTGLNPARDLGPRLVAWVMGWGNAAFPARAGGFFYVYVLGPLAGAAVASQLFNHILEPQAMGSRGTREPAPSGALQGAVQ